MSRRKTYGFSFSWKRALGISASRGKIARAIGIPTTKSGLQRKLGRSALGIGAGIVTGAVAKVANEATTNPPHQQPVSRTRTKNNNSCFKIIGGAAAIIIAIAVCGSLISQLSGGGNSTPTPTRRAQVQILNPTSLHIPTITPTYSLTPKPTLTSTPYPPGFRPTDTRWPTHTPPYKSPTVPYSSVFRSTDTRWPTLPYKSPTYAPYIPLPSGGGGGGSGGVGSNNPTGATALCKDGTLSYSQTHSGTCSHHGGVAVWYK